MKLEVVVDASGLPLGMKTAAADVSEQQLLLPALDDVPAAVPPGTPVIADRGHDADALRDALEAQQRLCTFLAFLSMFGCLLCNIAAASARKSAGIPVPGAATIKTASAISRWVSVRSLSVALVCATRGSRLRAAFSHGSSS